MKIMFALLILSALFISMRFAASAINRLGTNKSVIPYRIKYITKTVNLSLIVFYLSSNSLACISFSLFIVLFFSLN